MLLRKNIRLPLQNNFFFSEDGGDLTWNLNVRPLITRTIQPLFAQDGSAPGFDSGGLGYLNAKQFFSPNNDTDLISLFSTR